MSWSTALRKYAQTPDPTKLPPSVLFSHNSKFITIFDGFDKAKFHFLVLPRIVPPLTAPQLSGLRSLLKSDKKQAKDVMTGLAEEAKRLRGSIEEEMIKRYGFKWDIWTGFHAVPSMEHLHLHVISSDLVSPRLKNKKHYNSFHPKLGFFLHLDEVLEWFEGHQSYYDSKSDLPKDQYEPLLKHDLSCWRCNTVMKNMPVLKAHLQLEWDKEAQQKKGKLDRKRKCDDAADSSESTAGKAVEEGHTASSKKRATSSNEGKDAQDQ